jgi:hypothetical protein
MPPNNPEPGPGGKLITPDDDLHNAHKLIMCQFNTCHADAEVRINVLGGRSFYVCSSHIGQIKIPQVVRITKLLSNS